MILQVLPKKRRNQLCLSFCPKNHSHMAARQAFFRWTTPPFFSTSNRGENKTYLKPPPSYVWKILGIVDSKTSFPTVSFQKDSKKKRSPTSKLLFSRAGGHPSMSLLAASRSAAVALLSQVASVLEAETSISGGDFFFPGFFSRGRKGFSGKKTRFAF